VRAGGGQVDVLLDLTAVTTAPTRRDLLAASCEACGDVLGMDAAWFVSRGENQALVVDASWTRDGARPHRVGEGRLSNVLEQAEHSSHPAVEQHWIGRYRLISVPIVVQGDLVGALVGAARASRPLTSPPLPSAVRLGSEIGQRLLRLGGQEELPEPPAPPLTGGSIDEIRLLQSIAGALIGAHSESQVGEVVVAQLSGLIDYHSCRFYMLSDDGEMLVCAAHRGVGAVYEAEGAEELNCAIGEGITGTAFADGRAARVDDANAVPYAVDIPGTEPLDESMLVAPMHTESGPIGAIVLSKEGLRQFGDEQLRLLEVIAALAAAACDNARLVTRTREAAETAEALIDLGAALAQQTSNDKILELVALAVDRLVECAGISVWLRDGDELVPKTLVGYTPGEVKRLRAMRLPAAGVLETALDSRRVTLVGVDEAPQLAGCLDAAPAGTTFAITTVGERAANKACVIVQRGPRRGRPSSRDEQMLLGIADQALLAIINRSLYADLQESFLATVEALGNALDLKDPYTNEHALALVDLCAGVCGRIGMSAAAERDVSFAAALHDIGKIGIPASILQKPGPLTPEEFEVMKTHPELGARIIEPVAALAGARDIVIACHEHWDGTGYPSGLREEEIPLGARVILACDAYHAMTSDRVYRTAMSQAEAIAELRRCAGSHFDPDVVDALVAVIAAAA